MREWTLMWILIKLYPNKNVADKNLGLIELIAWLWRRFCALQSAILVLYSYQLNEKEKTETH